MVSHEISHHVDQPVAYHTRSRPFIGFFLHYRLQVKNNLKFKILDLYPTRLLSFLLHFKFNFFENVILRVTAY